MLLEIRPRFHLARVRDKELNDRSAFSCIFKREESFARHPAILYGFVIAWASGLLADDDSNTVVAHVQGLRRTLHAIAQDGHDFVFQYLARLFKREFVACHDVLNYAAKIDASHVDFIYSRASVTAPVEAEDTSSIYFRKTPRVYFGFGCFHSFRRFANSSSEISTFNVFFSASIETTSPFLMSPMGPPTYASGATWPMTSLYEPPEKRPSVISATESPSPRPMMAEVTASISRIPGPPFGPSFLITIVSPETTEPASIAANADSSSSNTFAGPRCCSFLMPFIFATPPPGARLPCMTTIGPRFITGSLMSRMTGVKLLFFFTSFRFSATVFPVMVMQPPCKRPASRSSFMTAGTPPASCKFTVRYFPPGFISTRRGVLSEIRLKSSIVSSTSAARAIAMRCSTALVEPPSAITTVMAFSNAFFVMMSRGLMSLFRSSLR